MRKALVLMMTTCILFAGCIEGLTEDVEEVVEELAPGCNDPTAFNYDENDTTATTCITEETLHRNIGEFVENSESEDSQAVIGLKMTMSGVDEEMGMGAYTMVSTMAENENTAYSGTDITVGGMTISQSWTIQESGDGTILQASYMDESFLMHSAMSWDDVSSDCHESCSECDDTGEGDCTVCPEGTTMFDEDRDGAGVCVTNDDERDRGDSDSEMTQEDCERRGGTWIEVTDRPIDGYCNFEDDGDRGDDDSEMTQEDCEERGGNWTEAPNREGQFYCDFGEEDREITQEDCEERGGNWTEAPDREGQFYCDFGEEDRDDERDDSDREDERDDSDGDMDMDIPDPMEFLSMLDGVDDNCRGNDCGFPENTQFDVGVDGITATIPTEEGIVKVNFDLVTGEMTGFTMDIYDGSHMTLELLTAEEVNTLLTIDTTLEYEALPFTLEEADAEDEYDVFICDDGEEIPADWENDGMEDCADGSDEDDWGDSVDDDEDPEFTGYWVGYETANWSCNWEDTADPGEDETAYFWSCDDIRDPPEDVGDNDWYYCEYYDDIATHYCTNGFGSQGTDENGEWGNSASFTHWRDGGDPRNVEDGGNDMFTCDNGEEIPASWVNDGMDDCGDNSDEGVEEQEEGPLNRTFVVTSDADFDFAGSFDDYSIVLANCVEETDDMGETTLTCDESKSTMYAIPGIIPGSNEDMDSFAEIVAFVDTDSSGTLTNGDVIKIDGNTSVEWTHVRLHSTSADAYSDENPMLTPGFTTILGALSLMGAAFINRRD